MIEAVVEYQRSLGRKANTTYSFNIDVLKSGEQQDKFNAGKLIAKSKEDEIINQLQSMQRGKSKKLKGI